MSVFLAIGNLLLTIDSRTPALDLGLNNGSQSHIALMAMEIPFGRPLHCLISDFNQKDWNGQQDGTLPNAYWYCASKKATCFITIDR